MTKRQRRTKAELEKDVMEAASSLAIEVGFSNITLVNLAERSKTGANVIHDNFGNLDNVLNIFANKHRFWFLSALGYATSSKDQTDVTYIKNLISQLLADSFDNKVVSEILRWEIAENNMTTEQLIESQEAFYKTIYYNQYRVRKKHPDTYVLFALLVGGIHYIALIKDKTSFWATDFNQECNKKKLQEMVNTILDRMLSDNDPKVETMEIARKFKVKGIDIQTIAECTGLSLEQIDAL